MVRRHKEEEIAGVLEFDGRSSDDPDFLAWLSDHKARNGGKIRVSQGVKGPRVMFGRAADMAFWKQRSEQEAKAKAKGSRPA